ncbi:protein kinase, ATP binding site-containing protein, partial [Tanacetum coccineum]
MGISRLYFIMRTCPPRFFESIQCSFDVALRSYLERIVTASGPGFGDWQWRLATLPFAFGGLGVYSAGDPIFDDALSGFNTSMETDLLSNLRKIAAPKLMKKMTDIYFTRVSKNAESTFLYLLDRWPCGLLKGRIIPLTGLGQSLFPSRTYYELCSRVFSEDIYGDHVVSCVGILGIKHRHNVVPYTLVDICYRSGISAGKEVDISGIKDLMCVDMTGYSPLTQTEMVDFVPGRAVIDVAQRELVKGALDARGSKLMPDKKDFSSELIETLAWAHERTPLANLIRWRDKPVALSIVQA